MVPSGRGIRRARCLLLVSAAAVPSGIRPLPWSTAREWWRESAYLQKPQASAPSSSLRTVFLLVWENLTPYYFLRAVPSLLTLPTNYSLIKVPQWHRILKTKAKERSLFAFFCSLSHTCLSPGKQDSPPALTEGRQTRKLRKMTSLPGHLCFYPTEEWSHGHQDLFQNRLFQRRSFPSVLSDTTINVKSSGGSKPNTGRRPRSVRARGTPEGQEACVRMRMCMRAHARMRISHRVCACESARVRVQFCFHYQLNRVTTCLSFWCLKFWRFHVKSTNLVFLWGGKNELENAFPHGDMSWAMWHPFRSSKLVSSDFPQTATLLTPYHLDMELDARYR